MQKKINYITSVLFAAILFGFAIAFFVLPDHSFSEQENRSLRTLPKLRFDTLISGDYASEINDYFADQFPMRDSLVGLKGIAELALGKQENNGILLGSGGQLADRLFDIKRQAGDTVSDMDMFDPETIHAAGEGLARVEASLSVPFDAFLVGRTVDVASSAFSYPSHISDALLQQMKETARDVSLIETVDIFRQKYDNGEYVYYKTDHHWTTLGAYYAYAEILRTYGMEDDILPIETFTRTTVSDAFYGTAWSAGGMKFVSPDSIELWTRGNEDMLAVTADGRELDGLYSMGYLQRKDQYSVFLDGTHDVVTVRMRDGTERPTLLLLKDSFANSVAPFLAQHFDLVLLNLSSTRSDFTNVTALAEQYEADRVLLIYTLENVVTADKLSRFH